MNKVEEIMDLVKARDIKELKDYFNKKEEAEKRNNTLIWIFAIIGVIAAVAGVAYLIYRYLTPDYLDDFDDDFDDDFEDDFFDDEDEEEPVKKEEKPVTENAAAEEDFAE
jgi:flagellar basal body-associated protein FliL